jgi:hypothetical protein
MPAVSLVMAIVPSPLAESWITALFARARETGIDSTDVTVLDIGRDRCRAGRDIAAPRDRKHASFADAEPRRACPGT